MEKIISMQYFLVFVSLILSLTLVSAQTGDLVAKTCSSSNVLYKDLCLKTLRADPASKTADIHGLVKIAITATVKDTSAVIARVDALLKSSSEDLKPALKDCSEVYGNAKESLDEAAAFAAQRRYGDFKTYVSAAMTDGDTCEDGFDAGKSPLTEDNKLYGQLCSNSLAISNIASPS